MVSKKNVLVKPFVKWAGGKKQLLPEIKKNLPAKINNYYEPFVGGGAVFLDLQLNKVIINDYNEELINSYKVIKNNVNELIDLLKKHKKNNCREYYYKIRAWDRNGEINTKSATERAARFIYLNKTGFNGLFRVNSQGQINVPYGSYKNPSIFSEEVLIAVSNYLNSVDIKILNGDYSISLEKAKRGDFVYLDPPYAAISDDKKSFVGYTLNGFNDNEQLRLKNKFDELTNRGVNAMLSNSKVPLILELYKSKLYNIKTVKANRSINSNKDDRGPVDEVLIMNY